MKGLLFLLALLMGAPVLADEPLDAERAEVLDCVSAVGVSTEWNSCLNLAFAPCAEHEVGGEGHLACLTQERTAWEIVSLRAQDAILPRLSPAGVQSLSALMVVWPDYVEDKCKAVGESRAAISADAAELGCTISELILLTNELRACGQGRSEELYCVLGE